MVKPTFLTFPDLDQICEIREKLVLPSLFFDFWSKSLKSDEKTNFSHISKIRVRFQDFLKVAFIVFFGFSKLFAQFAGWVLVFLVFSSLFDTLDQKSKKSDGKTNFSHISQIWTRFVKFEKSWFYHHFSLISGLKYQKVMRKPKKTTPSRQTEQKAWKNKKKQ